MITGKPPTVYGGHLYFPLVDSTIRKGQPRISLDVVAHALESDKAVLVDAMWGTGTAAVPVKVKVVRDGLAVLNSSSSVAAHERDAYHRLADRSGIHHIARCFGIFPFSPEGSPEDVTIFVLEKLGPSIQSVAQDRPDLRGELARLTLVEGLSAVLELSSVLVASRDPHPGNLVLASPMAPAGSLEDDVTIRMIDLGTSYLMGGGREAISSTGQATGLLQVQPPMVVSDGSPHKGLIDDAFSVAVSAYMVASGGNSPYVRHLGESPSRVTWGKERDFRLWRFEPDYAEDLKTCSTNVKDLIKEIFENAGTYRDLVAPVARTVVGSWQGRAEGSPSRTGHVPSTGSDEETVPDPTRVEPVTADTPATDDVIAAREWLKADRVKHVATRADFMPQFGRRILPEISPRLVIALTATVVACVGFLAASVLWPTVFGWYEVLPTAWNTFATWQAWLTAIAAVATGLSGALVVLIVRRRLGVRILSAVGVSAVVLATGVGAVAIGSEMALSAATSPLDCEGKVQPPSGSTISCVAGDDLPEWWVAEDPWVQTESEDAEGNTVAFDTTSRVGFNTGARIIYPFESELDECLGAWLYVYQSAQPVEWSRQGLVSDQEVTTSVLRQGEDIARFAYGRNTWEAYEWQEVDEEKYSSAREYNLTSRGQKNGLGSTLARLLVIATDCDADQKSEFDRAGSALLSKVELAPAATLDPAFVRVKNADSTIAAADFSVPVTEDIAPIYAWDWSAEGTWQAGTGAMLASAAGPFYASVALSQVPGDTASDGWVSNAGENGLQVMHIIFPRDEEHWRATIWVSGYASLDQEGLDTVETLKDGIMVFGQRVEEAQ